DFPSSEMQELSGVALVDFLTRLLIDLRRVDKLLPRLQEVLPFVPPVGIVRRKDDVIRAEDVEAAGEGIGIHCRGIVVHRLPVVARGPGDRQFSLAGGQEAIKSLNEVRYQASPKVMHDHLELWQLL